jgi:ankyrin repeat protein
MICNEQDRATPLHFAILANNYDNAKLLLKYHANPNAKDSSGNTPMHFAVAAKNLSMVRMLDEYGANATTKNVDGICPIDVSITEDLRDIKLHFIGQ